MTAEIRYQFGDDASVWFVQRACDPLPKWATNVEAYTRPIEAGAHREGEGK